MPQSCFSVRIVSFPSDLLRFLQSETLYPRTIRQIRGEPKKSCCLLSLLLLLLFPLFSFGSWVDYIQPRLFFFIIIYFYFFKGCLLLKTKAQVLKGVTLDSTVSLPLYYLNRCAFVAATLTGAPPR